MSESKTVRIRTEDKSEIEQMAERRGVAMKDVVSDLLDSESDGDFSLAEAEEVVAEAERAAERHADDLLKHIVLGECDAPRHEMIRERLGVAESGENSNEAEGGG